MLLQCARQSLVHSTADEDNLALHLRLLVLRGHLLQLEKVCHALQDQLPSVLQLDIPLTPQYLRSISSTRQNALPEELFEEVVELGVLLLAERREGDEDRSYPAVVYRVVVVVVTLVLVAIAARGYHCESR